MWWSKQETEETDNPLSLNCEGQILTPCKLSAFHWSPWCQLLVHQGQDLPQVIMSLKLKYKLNKAQVKAFLYL